MARALYDLCPTVKPEWDQLGAVAQSVWIERAEALQLNQAADEMAQQPTSTAPAPSPASTLQIDLF